MHSCCGQSRGPVPVFTPCAQRPAPAGVVSEGEATTRRVSVSGVAAGGASSRLRADSARLCSSDVDPLHRFSSHGTHSHETGKEGSESHSLDDLFGSLRVLLCWANKKIIQTFCSIVDCALLFVSDCQVLKNNFKFIFSVVCVLTNDKRASSLQPAGAPPGRAVVRQSPSARTVLGPPRGARPKGGSLAATAAPREVL